MKRAGLEATIETLSVAETVQVLRDFGLQTSEETVKLGLQDRRYPFGDYIPGGKAPRCYVYKKLLYQWISERV